MTTDIDICFACHLKIDLIDEILVGDKNFHVSCFKCASCSKFLTNVPYTVHEGNCYCQEDFLRNFGKQCSNCGNFILGEVIEAMGKFYCQGHFGCFTCGKPIVERAFKKFKGNAYCNQHFAEVAGIPLEKVESEDVGFNVAASRLQNLLALSKKEPELNEVYTLEELINVDKLHPSIDKSSREVRKKCHIFTKNILLTFLQ